MLSRRSFAAGLVAALFAPAIIRTPGLLMPIRARIVVPERRSFRADDRLLTRDGMPLGQWNELIRHAQDAGYDVVLGTTSGTDAALLRRNDAKIAKVLERIEADRQRWITVQVNELDWDS